MQYSVWGAERRNVGRQQVIDYVKHLQFGGLP
jgi:hypothetical protein